MKDKHLYNDTFYKLQMNESRISAQEIIPLLYSIFKPESVIDIGCGTGSWLIEFMNSGINDIIGVDGDYVNKKLLFIPPEKFHSFNLNEISNLNFNRKFGLAISVEVAEHIESENAQNFVKKLTEFSDIVLFSAGIPYQGGEFHRNENWMEYWAIKFKNENFYPVDFFRDKIWYNEKICPWYKQNIVLYVKENIITNFFPDFNYKNSFLKSYVHPEIYLLSCVKFLSNCESLLSRDIKYYQELSNSYISKTEIAKNKIVSYPSKYNRRVYGMHIKIRFKRFLSLIYHKFTNR